MEDKKIESDPFKVNFGSLQNLVDKIKDVLNCPVTIEDANHHLLAYSSHDDETDSARIATIIKRRVPEKVINQLWKAGVIPKLMQDDNPVLIPKINEIGLGNRVAISIWNNHEVIGYIWAVGEGERLSEEQLLLLKKAAHSARTELLKLHTQKKKKAEDYRDFFWQLLTGNIRSHDEIVGKFEKLNIKMPTQFAVLVFQFDEEITSKIEQNITYLITTSQKLAVPFVETMRNELIIIAAPSSTPFTEKTLTEFISFFISEMKNRFNVEHIKGSSGMIFDSFDKTETSYQEALKVLELKERFSDEMEGVYHYQQLGIFRFLDVILEKNLDTGYEHPAIERLQKYDMMNKTNLLETLEVFIGNDSNINDASKKLHVHSNTLNYRLKRIAEIGSIDLKNTNEKLSLFIDLKIRKMKRKTCL